MHEGNTPADRASEPDSLKKTLRSYAKLLPFVGIGLVIVAIAVAAILFKQRGAHVELTGSVQKVRTIAPEPNSTVALIDFRAHNPANYRFYVNNVKVFVTAPKGEEIEGQVVSDVDTQQLFQYYPTLGQRYNPTLGLRAVIGPGGTVDRMVAVRVEMPESLFHERRQIRIVIDELDAAEDSVILERGGK